MSDNIVMKNVALLSNFIAQYQEEGSTAAKRQIFNAIVVRYQESKNLDYAIDIYNRDLAHEDLKILLNNYDFSANGIEIETSIPVELVTVIISTRALIKHKV